MSLWYSEQERDELRFGLAIDEILFRAKSDFQTIEVLTTKAYGRMLVLDGCVMITDRDEFVYHEMITHVPVCLHPSPKSILVIGGGDGGTVRELLRHQTIESVTLCEIDGMVIEASKKYFPKLAGCLNDRRVKVCVGDGVAYVKDLKESVDILIVDSTDPVGPGEGLFSADFYRTVARALRPGGIMVAQSESPWHPQAVLRKIHANISAGFKYVVPYVGSIPTYPRGLWSWTLGSQLGLKPTDYHRERLAKLAGDLSYLTPDLYTACFALPRFYQEKLGYEKS